MNTTTERRRYKRYPVKKGTYAVLKPHYDIMGPVIDISKGGLSFHYYPLEKNESIGPQDSAEKMELSILSDDGGFFLGDIKIHVVSDMKAQKNGGDPSKTMRCSLQFDGIGQTKQLELRELISNIKQ